MMLTDFDAESYAVIDRLSLRGLKGSAIGTAHPATENRGLGASLCRFPVSRVGRQSGMELFTSFLPKCMASLSSCSTIASLNVSSEK
jgi:hypothetical protein